MTPTLIQAVATGEHLQQVAVQFTNGIFTSSYCLKDAFVTGVSNSANAGAERLPTTCHSASPALRSTWVPRHSRSTSWRTPRTQIPAETISAERGARGPRTRPADSADLHAGDEERVCNQIAFAIALITRAANGCGAAC